MDRSSDQRPSDHSYRFYSLAPDGVITGAESREFDCDAEALVHAQGMLSRHTAVEVWQTHGMVGVLKRSLLTWADRIGAAVPQPLDSFA